MKEYTNSQMEVLISEHIHSRRDRDVMTRRLCDGATYEQIGREFCLSPQWVKEIITRGKRYLERYL